MVLPLWCLVDKLYLKIRKVIVDKGVWKVAMPGLATVAEVRQDIEVEQQERAMSLLAHV